MNQNYFAHSLRILFRNGLLPDEGEYSFEKVLELVAETARTAFLFVCLFSISTHPCESILSVRRRSSSHKEGRWVTWAFTAPGFQLAALLLVVFWSCIEESWISVGSCCRMLE